jgi:hypothetical protein
MPITSMSLSSDLRASVHYPCPSNSPPSAPMFMHQAHAHVGISLSEPSLLSSTPMPLSSRPPLSLTLHHPQSANSSTFFCVTTNDQTHRWPSVHKPHEELPFAPSRLQQISTRIVLPPRSVAHVSDALGVKHLVAQFGLTLTSTCLG